MSQWLHHSLNEGYFISPLNLNDLCPILILHVNFLLFCCFENCLHHLTGIPSRVLQRTSSIKGPNPQRMPLRAKTGERLFGANHVSLLSFPQVRRLNFSFIQERWFFQATKGPDLLFGGVELEIMERPQKTSLGNP